MRRILLSFSLALATAACSTGLNYTGLEEPRYAAGPESPDTTLKHGDTVTVASFNIKYGIEIDSSLAVLHGDSMLRRADIVADAKVILPHIGTFGRTQRTATAATVRIGETLVRIYSAHLGTPANVTPRRRRDQLKAILEDARGYRHVVMGGDMNSQGVGKVARDAGYLWPTESGPKTVVAGRWDHVFLKGLTVPSTESSGTILDNHHASDHKPIWVRALIAR